MIINPNTIIGECLETAWGLPQYMDIISKVNKNAFKASADFRTSFNAYYRVRQRKSEWYDAYYELMENQKHYPLSFEQLLRKLMTFGNIETSFSRMLIVRYGISMFLKAWVAIKIGIPSTGKIKKSVSVKLSRFMPTLKSGMQIF